MMDLMKLAAAAYEKVADSDGFLSQEEIDALLSGEPPKSYTSEPKVDVPHTVEPEINMPHTNEPKINIPHTSAPKGPKMEMPKVKPPKLNGKVVAGAGAALALGTAAAYMYNRHKEE